MHRVAGTKPLAEQHTRLLRQLRDANDRHVHRQHLTASGGGASPRGRSASPARGSEERTGPRTVEAVVEARREANEREVVTKATRLREKIAASRRGIQTERSDRSPLDAPPFQRRPLLPSLDGQTEHEVGETGRSGTAAALISTRKIGAVRRRLANQNAGAQVKRRMGKDETEWMEKQLQFAQRASALERECLNAWRVFYSSASTASASSPSNAPSVINRQLEEIGLARSQDGRVLLQQLATLREKAARITQKVHEMRDGTRFFSELEDLIEDMEQSLSAFREAQLGTYEAYALEENVLEKNINAFLERMEAWEQPEREKSSKTQRPDTRHGNRSLEQARSSVDGGGSEGPTEEELVRRVRHLNDTIIQSGGFKDGWDDRDHAIFLHELSKCGLSDGFLRRQCDEQGASDSNQRVHDIDHVKTITVVRDVDYEALVARFIRKCTTKLVTKTADGVRSHWRWYIGHTKLVDEKKRVIADWKQRKEKQRRELLTGTEDYDIFDEQAVLSNAGRDQRKKTKKSNGSPESDKDAAEKAQRLREWKEQRLQQEMEYEREQQMIQEEREAKRRQAHLDAKQKLLVYKQQKEEEASLLKSIAREEPATPSPPRKEELMERSRQAIEQARAKRAQLEALEARRKTQGVLPPRPESAKRMIESRLKSTDGAAVLQATESFKARAVSKQAIRKKSRERQRQNAHDAYIPGGDVASEVKVKSFGHIAIQPRAIPAWRKHCERDQADKPSG